MWRLRLQVRPESAAASRGASHAPISAAAAVRLAHTDPKLQTRVVLFTVANPLMIWGVLVGAHNESLSVVFALVGLLFYRKYPWAAGIGIGLAGTVKVSMVFYGIAMCWGYRKDWRKLLQLIGGAAVPLAIAYGLWMPNALLAAQRNGWVSHDRWTTLIRNHLEARRGHAPEQRQHTDPRTAPTLR